jgi:hypothetical protein
MWNYMCWVIVLEKGITRITLKNYHGICWQELWNSITISDSNLGRDWMEHDLPCMRNCVNLLTNELVATTDLNWWMEVPSAIMNMERCGKWNKEKKCSSNSSTTSPTLAGHRGTCARQLDCWQFDIIIPKLYSQKERVKISQWFVASHTSYNDSTVATNSIFRPSYLTLKSDLFHPWRPRRPLFSQRLSFETGRRFRLCH